VSISPLGAAFRGRCPACGKGKLFRNVLSFHPACHECGLEFSKHEKGDGPAFFALTLVGFIVTVLAAWVEITWQPDYWVHAALWLPLIIFGSLFGLRFFKALMLAAQWRHGIL
jgi:uncharacterized protein (DUF983 family)